MNAIGGYFELELSTLGEYHQNAIQLNSGRNALEYILIANNYEKIYLPYYTCDVLLQPIQKLKISYEFYKINELLEPIFDYDIIQSNECFLYTNYFGLKNDYVQKIANSYSNLIIDNAQSFYSNPIQGIDTFYSPRKFFGVSDGAYLFCNKKLEKNFCRDSSYNRMEHLLIRADKNAEEGYSCFSKNDCSLDNQEILLMSSITNKILNSINYEVAKETRIQNFNYLDKALNEINNFNWELQKNDVPMVYPLWTSQKGLREKLIENKIYVATYWSNVLTWCKEGDLEIELTNDILHLPIDQRYGKKDMDIIISIIING